MTIIADRQLVQFSESQLARPVHVGCPVVPHPARTAGGVAARRRSQRPMPARPALAAFPHRGTGISGSRVVHRPRPVSVSVTIVLAGLAALITLWLGSLAQLSAARSGAPAAVTGQLSTEQLAVVHVQVGETLQQLAGRVAPDLPVGSVVERIQELNKLESTTVAAGRSLIAPLA